MPEPLKPSAKDAVMLGQLSETDFEASVSLARDAMRARIGLPPEGPRPVPVAAPTTILTAPTLASTAMPTTHSGSPAQAGPVAAPPMAPRAVPPMPAPIAQPRPAPSVVPPAPAPVLTQPAMPMAVPSVARAAHAMPAPMPVEPIVSPAAIAPAASARSAGIRVSVPMLGACLLVLAALGGGLLYFQFTGGLGAAAPPAVATTGSVQIVSQPAGATVIVDGVSRGIAPLNLTLPNGPYTLELVSGATRRTLPLVIDGGTLVKQYVDFAAAGAATFGRIDVTSDPAGAEVTVDGAVRGATPILLADIAPGPHTITIGQGDTLVTRAVDVVAGSTASVVATIAPTTGAAGWVAIKSPLPVEVLEGGRTVATPGVDRVMLPTGRHELEVVSSEFEFRSTVTVYVQAGKTTNTNIALPNGTLSINAVPWAEITLDGKPMGTTPLGNLSVAIGTHEIVFTHPQHGERRQTVKVKAQTPVRAGMDFGR